MARVTLNNVRKSYGSLEVVHGVNLEVESGEFVVFVGPSGCGKSTLLRMIAGLENITSGNIEIGGAIVNDVPSPARGISMVFQSYALYPHMSVFDNMAFGLKLSKTPPAEIDERVRNAARILQLEDYLDRMPKALSGGQRQRVAIGRAIVRDPKVFLFDEPLSNLDAALRAQTRFELAKLHDALDATMIYVTHDQVEAMTLADRIVVLNDGNIEQVGSPLDLYNKPKNMFVAGFISSPKMNFLDVVPEFKGGQTSLKFSNNCWIKFDAAEAKRTKTVGIRPEHLKTVAEKDTIFSGKLEVLEQFGEHSIAYLELGDGSSLTVRLDGAPDLVPKQILHIGFDPKEAHLFDVNGVSLL